MSDYDEIQAFIKDPVLQQRLAKHMVRQCFRNSMLGGSPCRHISVFGFWGLRGCHR
jgi:hypothetical protein